MLLLHLAMVSLEHNAVWLDYKFNLTKLLRTWSFLNLSFHKPGAALFNYWLTHSCSHFEITTKPGIKKFFASNFFDLLLLARFKFEYELEFEFEGSRFEIFNFLLFFFIIDTSLTLAWSLQQNKRIREKWYDAYSKEEKEMAEVFIKSYQNIKISVGGVIQGGCTLWNEKKDIEFCYQFLLLLQITITLLFLIEQNHFSIIITE